MDQTPEFSNVDTNKSKGIFLGGETLLKHLETQEFLLGAEAILPGVRKKAEGQAAGLVCVQAC